MGYRIVNGRAYAVGNFFNLESEAKLTNGNTGEVSFNDVLNNINDEDIAVLFGNIFDNAIEAAEKIEDKFISLEIQKQGAYISIYMENSFDGLFDPELKSRKGEKHEHGIGMRNVRRIVEEYNGMMKCFAEENIFCCDILLKAC